MSSRAEQKAARRQSRQHDRRITQRRHARARLAVVTAAATALVAAAIVASQTAGRDSVTSSTVAAPVAVQGRYAGIPQQGNALGPKQAPATLVEFADLQCPFCGMYARDVLPSVVERYVRPGKLRLESRVLTFLGEDSVTAGRMAAAAALQNRLWSFTDAFYAGQGQENSGYVTDEYLARAGAGAGIDVETARRQRDTPEAAGILQLASSEAQRLGVQSTPSFFLRRGDGALRPLKVSRLTPAAFTAALDDALAAR